MQIWRDITGRITADTLGRDTAGWSLQPGKYLPLRQSKSLVASGAKERRRGACRPFDRTLVRRGEPDHKY